MNTDDIVYDSEARAVIDITREAEAGVLRALDPATRLYSVTVPEDYSRETIDLSKYLDHPQRYTGTARLQTVDDLSAYVTRHDDADATTVWVDIEGGKIVALLNDHGAGFDDPVAGWGDHRAELLLKPTEAWTHWANMSGRMMTQEAFAEHVEDGLDDIIAPTNMLDIVTTMQGKTDADWKSGIRLSDGSVQFRYQEEATATAGGAGELKIPQEFELALCPFLGEDPWKVKARLRYRVKAGTLTIGYKLHRPEDVRRKAIDEIATRLSQRFQGEGDAVTQRVFVGIPR